MALFVSESLRTNQPEQVLGEMDTQEKLEQSSLSDNTTQSDWSIKIRAVICSKPVRKWLNRLNIINLKGRCGGT